MFNGIVTRTGDFNLIPGLASPLDFASAGHLCSIRDEFSQSEGSITYRWAHIWNEVSSLKSPLYYMEGHERWPTELMEFLSSTVIDLKCKTDIFSDLVKALDDPHPDTKSRAAQHVLVLLTYQTRIQGMDYGNLEAARQNVKYGPLFERFIAQIAEIMAGANLVTVIRKDSGRATPPSPSVVPTQDETVYRGPPVEEIAFDINVFPLNPNLPDTRREPLYLFALPDGRQILIAEIVGAGQYQNNNIQVFIYGPQVPIEVYFATREVLRDGGTTIFEIRRADETQTRLVISKRLGELPRPPTFSENGKTFNITPRSLGSEELLKEMEARGIYLGQRDPTIDDEDFRPNPCCTSLEGHPFMDYQAIDQRIDQIPKEHRLGLGFSLGVFGFRINFTCEDSAEKPKYVFFYNVIGFTAYQGDLIVAEAYRNDPPYSVTLECITKDGQISKIEPSTLPEEVQRELNLI